MNLKQLDTEQVKDYIRYEREKGRSMREILEEVVKVRSDVTLLSNNSEIAEQQILSALESPSNA